MRLFLRINWSPTCRVCDKRAEARPTLQPLRAGREKFWKTVLTLRSFGLRCPIGRPLSDNADCWFLEAGDETECRGLAATGDPE
jgi:hypothetical protein